LERLGLGDFWGDFFLTHLVTLIYVLKAGWRCVAGSNPFLPLCHSSEIRSALWRGWSFDFGMFRFSGTNFIKKFRPYSAHM
jgi:hypothetical protein